MGISLYDLLKKEVKQMIIGIGKNGQGNLHPLIIGEIEKYLIELVLQETAYNYVATAKILGIGRSTLYRKIQELKISRTP